MQSGWSWSALREMQSELLHRNWWLLRGYHWLWGVRVRERLTLWLAAKHHCIPRPAWMSETHLATQIGEHDAQCQGISVKLFVEKNK
jgi:hypothetical protein